MRWLLPALVLACSQPAAEQPPAEQKPQKPAADQKPKPAAQEPAAATDAELVEFCAQNYFKMMDCFKDTAFWEVFSTLYFANAKLTVDDTERQHWIGVLKEDLLRLHGAREFEKNCEASLRHNKAPSLRSLQAVKTARSQSCAAFGSAFGYMVFNEGAFHQPK